MKEMGGWTRAYRKIWESPIFRDNGLRAGAWLWMIHRAAWKPMRLDVGGAVVELQRGQFCASQAEICARTGMSRQQLRSFLAALEANHAITITPAHGATKGRRIITLCNYGEYQDAETAINQARNQAATKEQPTKEEGKNSVAKATGAERRDLASILFGEVREWLMRAAGKSDNGARRLIGGWKKRGYTDAEIYEACSRAQRESPAEPVAFIEGCLNWRRKKSDPDRWAPGEFDAHLDALGYHELTPREDDENYVGNSPNGGDRGSPPPRDTADDLSGMLTSPPEEARSMPGGDVQGGWCDVVLPPLRAQGR